MARTGTPCVLDGAAGVLGLVGRLHVDSERIRRAAEDFGHLVNARPCAVLEPGTVDDIRSVMTFAADHGIPVAARGGGHSLYGQGQAGDGIVIDMTSLGQVVRVTGESVVVGAGARWADVLAATLPHGLTPPVLTDHLGTSVGGTLSVGGIGGMSHLHGLQTDNVLDLDVVTGTGQQLRCSPTQNQELYDAVRAGLGQCGVIVRATLRLVTACPRVRRYKLFYDDPAVLLDDQRRLMGDDRFGYVEGRAVPAAGGAWRFLAEVAVFHQLPDGHTVDAVLDGLRHDHTAQHAEDLSYLDFLHRGDTGEQAQRATGAWHRPHPWLTVFLPDTAALPFTRDLLSGLTEDDLGEPGLVLLYPTPTERMRTPLVRRPTGPLAHQLALLRTAPPGDPSAVDRMVTENRALYERARAVGAVAYPVNALPMSPDDWRSHYGPAWEALLRAKRRFDPAAILAPEITLSPHMRKAPS